MLKKAGAELALIALEGACAIETSVRALAYIAAHVFEYVMGRNGEHYPLTNLFYEGALRGFSEALPGGLIALVENCFKKEINAHAIFNVAGAPAPYVGGANMPADNVAV